jgi:hypothetical protein
MSRRVWIPLSFTLCLACGPNRPESLVDDLRFVAARVDPPELAPGSPFTVTWEIADPTRSSDAPLEYLLVACTRLAGFGDCLELGDLALIDPGYVNEDLTVTPEGYHAFFQPGLGYVVRGQTPAGTLETPLVAPFSPTCLLEDPAHPDQNPCGGGEPPFPLQSQIQGQVFLLTCADGGCSSLLDRVDAYIAGTAETDDGQALLDTLVTGSYLADYPVSTTAMAAKSYLMSRRTGDALNQNPHIDAILFAGVDQGSDGTAIEVPAGSAIDLEAIVPESFRQSYVEDGAPEGATPIPETIVVRWYTTAGSVQPGSHSTHDPAESFASTFNAPAEAGTVLLWATVEDERFGSDYTLRTLEVR